MRAIVAILFALVITGGLRATARAQSCFSSSITSPSPFMGNNDELFQLADGSVWKVKYEYSYLYAYYPDVTICPGDGKLIINGKALNVESVASARGGAAARPAAEISVVAADSGCHDYFVASGPRGYYLLEWYGGHDPSVGDKITGDIDGYGFRDIYYTNASSSGRVWVDDYALSRTSVAEKYARKCE